MGMKKASSDRDNRQSFNVAVASGLQASSQLKAFKTHEMSGIVNTQRTDTLFGLAREFCLIKYSKELNR
jgi:hypothetical protein